MADLHPKRRAAGLPGISPSSKRIKWRALIEHDPARSGQRLGVDHHVAGDQQARAAGRPAAIERNQALVGELRTPAMFSSIAAFAMRLRTVPPERNRNGENSSVDIKKAPPRTR